MDEISMISTTAILSLMMWKRSPAAKAEKAKPTVLEAVADMKTADKAIARGQSRDSSGTVCSVMRSPVTGKAVHSAERSAIPNQLWRATVRRRGLTSRHGQRAE